MSNENNTIIAEERLANLEQEVVDTKQAYDNDTVALKDAEKNIRNSEVNYLKAKLELALAQTYD